MIIMTVIIKSSFSSYGRVVTRQKVMPYYGIIVVGYGCSGGGSSVMLLARIFYDFVF